MNLFTKLFCALLLIVIVAGKSKAQHYMGVATSDYSAINSLYLNPASISDCKEKIVVNMFSLSLSADNNLGTISKLSDITSSASGNSSTSAFTNSGRQTFSMLLPVLEVRGPSILISLDDDHKQSFAFTTRLRVMNQFNNFDQSIYNTVTNPSSVSNGNYTYNSKNFNWTASVWDEYGLTYALTILNQGQSEIKAGATLRYLGGIAYLGLKGNNVDVGLFTGSDSFHATNSDIEFASNLTSVSNVFSNGLSFSNLASKFFGGGDGSGVGGDIGVTYIYHIDKGGEKPRGIANTGDGHKLSLSASVTDLGSIKYKAANNAIVNVSGNGYMTGQGLADSIKSFTSFRNYAKQQGFKADTAAAATKVHMPTALVLSADYEVYKPFYLNVTYIGNLVNRQLFGNSYYSQLTITPRVDMKVISIGLPITYSTLAHDMKMGLGIRFGGFFVGSDDMLALFSSNQSGFGFYMGGYVPIFKKKHKSEHND